MEKQTFIIDVHCLRVAPFVDNARHAFLVHANTKRQAMTFLMDYLEDNNFITARIKRYDIRVLSFDESPVIQMRN